MRDVKVSIIVPVYKVEKFLDRCIRSLIEQTYPNLEIILVDDGSPDSCGAKCDNWSNKDKRVISLHKKNGGLSDARNYGVRYATGDYIMFVDSDDYVANNIVELLLSEIFKYDADIACCNYLKTTEDFSEFDKSVDEEYVLSGRDACLSMMNHFYFLTTAWASLIRSDIVAKYEFPVGRNQEDEATTYKYYYASSKVVVTTAKLYGYYQNPNSIMNSHPERNTRELLMALSERMQFFEVNGETELKEKTLSLYAKNLISAVNMGYVEYNVEVRKILQLAFKNKSDSIKFRLFLLAYLIFGKNVLASYKLLRWFCNFIRMGIESYMDT